MEGNEEKIVEKIMNKRKNKELKKGGENRKKVDVIRNVNIRNNNPEHCILRP